MSVDRGIVKTQVKNGKRYKKQNNVSSGDGFLSELVRRGVRLCDILCNLIFPPRCPACDGILRGWDAITGKRLICPECAHTFKPITDPWCLKCGKKLSAASALCRDCATGTHHYICGRSVFEYPSIATSIYRFKYGNRPEYARFYAQAIYRELQDFIEKVQPDVLIPIPLHKKRENMRGYNQAYLLAKELSKITGIPVDRHLVLRVKNTSPLKQMNPKDRQNNLKKAFKIVGNDVKLNTIILIDDIYTTGSTIEEITCEFLQRGVKKIYFITLAGNMEIQRKEG